MRFAKYFGGPGLVEVPEDDADIFIFELFNGRLDVCGEALRLNHGEVGLVQISH